MRIRFTVIIHGQESISTAALDVDELLAHIEEARRGMLPSARSTGLSCEEIHKDPGQLIGEHATHVGELQVNFSV